MGLVPCETEQARFPHLKVVLCIKQLNYCTSVSIVHKKQNQ